jgi:uncharacterized protein
MLKAIKNYPLISFFSLTYFMTWGLSLLIAYPKLISDVPLAFEDIGTMFLVMLFVPSTIGILMTHLIYGKSGIQAFFLKMKKVNLNFKWYLIAILTTPIVLLLVLIILSVFVSREFMPGFQVIGIILGFAAGFFEEIGWTGFALPELQKKYSVLKSGLILGLIWGIWHLFADYLGANIELGVHWLPIFLFRYVFAVTFYRVLMVYVYHHTQSIFIAQLMHGCFSGALFAFGPISTHENTAIWNGIFAIALGLTVIIFYLFVYRKKLIRN